MKPFTMYIALICLSAVWLSGCSETRSRAGSDEITSLSKEPVKLKVYSYSTAMTDSQFQKFFVEPVQNKHPNISFEYIVREGDRNSPEQLLLSGNHPDLLLVSDIYIGMFKNLGMAMNLTDRIKKKEINLNRFDVNAMDIIRMYGGKDEIFAFPFAMNFGMTAYNKDIFDKFGVDYPKDIMTWDELLELGKSLREWTKEFNILVLILDLLTR